MHATSMVLSRGRLKRAISIGVVAIAFSGAAAAARAQDSREAEIAQAKAEKAKVLHPYVPTKAEDLLDRAEELLLTGGLHWHPFFDSAYAGGGFTLGAGYRRYVSSYNTVDLRGSITFSGYKRSKPSSWRRACSIAAASLSVIGGWREATQVGFYGIGTAPTSQDDRANYSFTQPYASGHARGLADAQAVRLGGGLEDSQWEQGPGGGRDPSVEEVYTPATLPGPRGQPDLPARAGDRPASTGARRPATRAAAASTA